MFGSHASPDVAAEDIRLGVVMLCHDNLDIAGRMTKIWHDGGAAVSVHVDRTADASAVATLKADLSNCDRLVWAARRHCEWGTFALVEATQDAAQALLTAFPDVTHVMIVSGACLPLRPVNELCAFLARDPDTDFIESVNALDVQWAIGGLNLERFTLRFPFSFRRQRGLFDRYVALQRRVKLKRRIPEGVVPHLGSQWWCLTRTTLQAILSDPRRAEFDRYFRAVWIPDECYFQTLARRHTRRIANRSLTLARFDGDGRPYLLFDDHAEMLAKSACFAARKVWRHAAGLYAQFPQAAGMDTNPDPRGFAEMTNLARRRRQIGRPGLYNQGRFPRRNDNEKTAGPFGIAYGMTDVFPDFQQWLSARIDADVHGHVFHPETVEFAGGVHVGPGALPDSAPLRDRDPRSFLSSLVRMSERMPVMMMSARDSQALGWDLATDPNLRFVGIFGAWMLPLLNSEMPFDDIRRMAARLQRREIETMALADSPWVRARVRFWTLPQVMAHPQAVLADVLQTFGANPLITDHPKMRDVTGLRNLLRRLSEAGLHPRRFGDIDRMETLSAKPQVRGQR